MNRSEYRFPDVPQELATAYRTAHRAFEALLTAPGYGFVPERDIDDALEVISQFSEIAHMAEGVIDAHFGPRIAWVNSSDEMEFSLTAAGVNLDSANRASIFGPDLEASSYEGDRGSWSGGSLNLAAIAYKRETRWDFTPGEAGIWVLMLGPESAVGGGDDGWAYWGRVAGFVILNDRDHDGEYETVSHIWTARAWRRQGIATQLLQEARSRLGYKKIERPLTDDSAALLAAHPELAGT